MSNSCIDYSRIIKVNFDPSEWTFSSCEKSKYYLTCTDQDSVFYKMEVAVFPNDEKEMYSEVEFSIQATKIISSTLGNFYKPEVIVELTPSFYNTALQKQEEYLKTLNNEDGHKQKEENELKSGPSKPQDLSSNTNDTKELSLFPKSSRRCFGILSPPTEFHEVHKNNMLKLGKSLNKKVQISASNTIDYVLTCAFFLPHEEVGDKISETRRIRRTKVITVTLDPMLFIPVRKRDPGVGKKKRNIHSCHYCTVYNSVGAYVDEKPILCPLFLADECSEQDTPAKELKLCKLFNGIQGHFLKLLESQIIRVQAFTKVDQTSGKGLDFYQNELHSLYIMEESLRSILADCSKIKLRAQGYQDMANYASERGDDLAANTNYQKSKIDHETITTLKENARELEQKILDQINIIKVDDPSYFSHFLAFHSELQQLKQEIIAIKQLPSYLHLKNDSVKGISGIGLDNAGAREMLFPIARIMAKTMCYTNFFKKLQQLQSREPNLLEKRFQTDYDCPATWAGFFGSNMKTNILIKHEEWGAGSMKFEHHEDVLEYPFPQDSFANNEVFVFGDPDDCELNVVALGEEYTVRFEATCILPEGSLSADTEVLKYIKSANSYSTGITCDYYKKPNYEDLSGRLIKRLTELNHQTSDNDDNDDDVL